MNRSPGARTLSSFGCNFGQVIAEHRRRGSISLRLKLSRSGEAPHQDGDQRGPERNTDYLH